MVIVGDVDGDKIQILKRSKLKIFFGGDKEQQKYFCFHTLSHAK